MFRVVPTRDDGDCGLHSLVFLLKAMDIQVSVQTLRRQLAERLSVELVQARAVILDNWRGGSADRLVLETVDDVFAAMLRKNFWLTSSHLLYLGGLYNLFPLILVRKEEDYDTVEATCRLETFMGHGIAAEFRADPDAFRVGFVEFSEGQHFQPLVIEGEAQSPVMSWLQVPAYLRRQFKACVLKDVPRVDEDALCTHSRCQGKTLWLAPPGWDSDCLSRREAFAEVRRHVRFALNEGTPEWFEQADSVVIRIVCLKRQPLVFLDALLVHLYEKHHVYTSDERFEFVQLVVPYSKASQFFELGFWPDGLAEREDVEDPAKFWPETPTPRLLKRLVGLGLLAAVYEDVDSEVLAEADRGVTTLADLAETGGVVLSRKMHGTGKPKLRSRVSL